MNQKYDNITGMLLEPMAKELDSLDSSIRETEGKLAAEMAKTEGLHKKRLQLIEHLESLSNSSMPAKDELGQEFDKFFGIPEVRGVEITGDELLVYTHPIPPDRGEFTMHFPLGPRSVSTIDLRFRGTGGSRSHHPHINSGQPCFGNVSDQMKGYLEQQQMFHAVVLGIEFLKS